MKFLFGKIFRIVLVVYVFVFAYQWSRPIPESLTFTPTIQRVADEDVHFLADETFVNEGGVRVVRQEIWDAIFQTIARAEHAIVLDMFLFNDFQGAKPETTRALSRELGDTLLEKRTNSPHVPIAVITDPINTVYGGAISPLFEQFRVAGIYVVMTDLQQLRDSNLTWSAFWRPFIALWENNATGGRFPHPFQYEGEKVTLRSWLTLLNFKANHRKLVVADEPVVAGGQEIGRRMVTIVTSSNPHDGSSAHGNVALKVDSGIWRDALQSETVIAALSGAGLPNFGNDILNHATGTLRASFLKERQIRDSAVALIEGMQNEDTLDIEMFYLSDRKVVRALGDAAKRGVVVRLILDPNKDAFGHQKNGIPNRPVAKELMKRTDGDISIRWCATNGEQCHGKMLLGKTASSTFLMLGSANLTRRNIGGFNLEANVLVEGDKEFTAWRDAHEHFERLWTNEGGVFTTDYETYKDRTLWKFSVYRIMEATGLSSF